MAGTVSEQTLEEIRVRADIVEIVEAHGLQLRRAGPDFKGCCPFHHEKTPSFFVSPSRRTFHCFGCGVHGDVFTYLMKSDGMTFMEAVKSLAQKTGVTLDLQTDYESVSRGVLLRLHSELAAFYRRCLLQLPEAQIARDYLKSRELDGETAERFGIGYAPAIRGVIPKWAEKHDFSLERLIEGGILLPPRDPRDGDDYYDRFSGRLIFPIRDVNGQVVAFSGRILTERKNTGKYVNSPETPIFKKGRVLYALDFAHRNILRDSRREALVCEGQIDGIRCHANGFGTAIASQGTAFTEEHVKLLKRYADSALLVFDGDGAGLKAAVRTGRLFLQQGIPVQVVPLPEGEDPDSLLRSGGPDAFQALLDAPESLVSFQIRVGRQLEKTPDSIDAVARISAEVVETLADCSKAILRDRLLQEAAQGLSISEQAVSDDLDAFLAKRAEGEKWRKNVSRPEPRRPAATGPARNPVAEPARPRPVSPRPAKSAKRPETALTEIAELLLQAPENIPPESLPEVFQIVREWLPSPVMGATPEAELIQASLTDQADGTDTLGAILQQTTPAGQLANTLMTRPLRTAGSEVPPATIIEDLVTRAWIDYLKAFRAKLDLSDPDQAMRRLALSTTTRKLAAARGWYSRAALILPEIQILAAKYRDGDDPS